MIYSALVENSSRCFPPRGDLPKGSPRATPPTHSFSWPPCDQPASSHTHPTHPQPKASAIYVYEAATSRGGGQGRPLQPATSSAPCAPTPRDRCNRGGMGNGWADLALRGVLWRREVLQHAHEAHLQPGRGDAVVGVVLRHAARLGQPLQHCDQLGNTRVVACPQERGRGGLEGVLLKPHLPWRNRGLRGCRRAHPLSPVPQ